MCDTRAGPALHAASRAERDEAIKSGLAARRAGDRSSALSHFRRAYKIDPAHLSARVEMAKELSDCGRLDEAEAIYRAILEETPDRIPPVTAAYPCCGEPALVPTGVLWSAVKDGGGWRDGDHHRG